ncbi:HAD family hydrolase [Fictibacillus sp. KIGAM418]|uniref:HAD family hydrolase n=1 Tax=Fictibacillus marinisediminis TaxID=2878389 RepID=A0A9X1XGV8_9BACL|nr:HAD hydrolase family protein [Fictibacillus marinisediminis]MCK6259448.1 HAD family hydrolase [Fictibacillus marinisediminis]
MRIVVDLDGTICELKKTGETYQDVKPKENAIETLHALKDLGHEIVIYTARRMRTHSGNVGKVTADIGDLTIEWLKNYNVPYDELVFGKPYGHVYIDDLAHRFTNWEDIQYQIHKGVYS